jgi:hypothetical protein
MGRVRRRSACYIYHARKYNSWSKSTLFAAEQFPDHAKSLVCPRGIRQNNRRSTHLGTIPHRCPPLASRLVWQRCHVTA